MSEKIRYDKKALLGALESREGKIIIDYVQKLCNPTSTVVPSTAGISYPELLILQEGKRIIYNCLSVKHIEERYIEEVKENVNDKSIIL